MAIEIGLNDASREQSVAALKRVLAETYALYTKTHGYHWNVTGPHFQSLHAMFMEQYTELWTALDELAERIRALGHFAPGSSGEMLESATIAADNEIPDAPGMITNLVHGHETLARALRDGIKASEAAGDDVTVDLLIQRATISDKTAWMLRSTF